MIKIAPSILAADFTRLGEQIAQVQEAGADWIHVDVMDGHFVPNLTLGPPIVKAVRAATTLPLDVHLMITNPERLIDAFAEAGSDYVLVHQETCPHLHATLAQIRQRGCKPGVVVNPATPLELVDPVLELVEVLLVMSVNPGFGGQEFIDATYRKIEQARRRKTETGLPFEIEVDGGIKKENAAKVIAAGADVLVVGTGIFAEADYRDTIAKLRRGDPD